MALRIPLPGLPGEALMQGLNTGSSMFSRLMQPIISREQMAQQAALQQQRMQQQAQQFEQNLALKKLAEDRASQLFPMQQKAIEAQANYRDMQARRAEMESDPARKAQYINELLKNVSQGMGGDNAWMADPVKRAVVESGLGRPIGLTVPQQEALQLFGSLEPEEAKQYVANRSQTFLPGQQQAIPESFGETGKILQNAVNMGSFSPSERKDRRKEMNQELEQIQTSKHILKSIKDVRRLMAENPDLYKKAVGIIFDPNKDAGAIQRGLKALLPKEQLTAFVSIDKIMSDIVNKQAEKLGARGTNYRTKLLQRAKASAQNPDEANEMILSFIEDEIRPQVSREKALLHSMKNNLFLPRTIDYDVGDALTEAFDVTGSQNPNNPENIRIKAQQRANPNENIPTKPFKGILDGEEINNIHPSRYNEFIAKGGRLA